MYYYAAAPRLVSLSELSPIQIPTAVSSNIIKVMQTLERRQSGRKETAYNGDTTSSCYMKHLLIVSNLPCSLLLKTSACTEERQSQFVVLWASFLISVASLIERLFLLFSDPILSRGLNFTITPKRILREDFISVAELACQKIKDQGPKAELCNKIAGKLKSAKLPPSNVTREEVGAIYTLTKDKTITILPADKGRTTVLMDTEKYERQMKAMLKDTNTKT